MCVRQLALPNRQVVVIDKKRQGSKGGEYSGIAVAMGAQSIRFRTGTTGMRINLLDPAIATGVERTDGVAPAGQEALVGAVIEDTMGRPLVETEKAARALNRVDQAEDGVEHLRVVRILLETHQIDVELVDALAGLGQELC